MGVIAGPKGIKGEVKVKSFTEFPADIASYGPLENRDGTVSYTLTYVGQSKLVPVVRIKGVTDRNQAEALKGTELYMARDMLPEPEDAEEYYHADLIGLAAVFKDGARFGKVLRVFEFGAGDMLEVMPDGGGAGGAVLIPFTREMVPEVDVQAGRVVLELPEDFFDMPERDDTGQDEKSRE
jgi:16S rRNA processing protein RimM